MGNNNFNIALCLNKFPLLHLTEGCQAMLIFLERISACLKPGSGTLIFDAFPTKKYVPELVKIILQTGTLPTFFFQHKNWNLEHDDALFRLKNKWLNKYRSSEEFIELQKIDNISWQYITKDCMKLLSLLELPSEKVAVHSQRYNGFVYPGRLMRKANIIIIQKLTLWKILRLLKKFQTK